MSCEEEVAKTETTLFLAPSSLDRKWTTVGRDDICQKFYTAEISGQQFYTDLTV